MNPETLAPLPERAKVTPPQFWTEIFPQQKPVVMRGLVSDWPAVGAARASDDAICDYLLARDTGSNFNTLSGPRSIRGRLFYNSDLSGFNFQVGNARLAAVLDFIRTHADEESPPAMAIQSLPVRSGMPGFVEENRMGLLDESVEPRIWIGGKLIVAPHYDPSENIACVVAGRRRFTLFPPDQVKNLYVGPIEVTPAGTTISMVSVDQPDFERYPRFRDALAAAQSAVLEPGDAIFIPTLWWHHVASIDRLNILVNYWWGPPVHERNDPRDAMLHAMLALRHIPKAHREAWRAMFDHYVFDADPGEHLPPNRRGILAPRANEQLTPLRQQLAAALLRRPPK